MNKVYCPIFSIGFEAPTKGERDPRVCMKDCAWYNEVERTCNINVIAEHMEAIRATNEGIADAVVDIYEYKFDVGDDYDNFGIDEEEEDFRFRSSKRT